MGTGPLKLWPMCVYSKSIHVWREENGTTILPVEGNHYAFRAKFWAQETYNKLAEYKEVSKDKVQKHLWFEVITVCREIHWVSWSQQTQCSKSSEAVTQCKSSECLDKVGRKAHVKFSWYTKVTEEVAQEEGTEKCAFCYFHILWQWQCICFVHNWGGPLTIKPHILDHLMWKRSDKKCRESKTEKKILFIATTKRGNNNVLNFANEAVCNSIATKLLKTETDHRSSKVCRSNSLQGGLEL